MSLIGEALKRARQEAAYQEAAREGRTWGPAPAYPPPRAKTWPLLAAGVAAGALLVAALGGGLYWLLGRDGRQAAEVEARAERPAAPGVTGVVEAPGGGSAEDAAAAVPVIVEEEEAVRPAVSPESSSPDAGAPAAEDPVQDPRARPVPNEAERLPVDRIVPGQTGAGARRPQAGSPALPDPGQERTPSPEGTAGVRGEEIPQTSPNEAGAAQTPSAPSVETPRPGPAEESARPAAPAETRPSAPEPAGTEAAPAPAGETPTYVGEATLPQGAKLELTGIAFSDDQPVALINGRVMGPGEVIEGYTLVRIEDGRVELRSRSGSLFLVLR